MTSTETLTPKKRVSQARTFPVVEIFGPVLQGEGRMIGVQTLFVRFGYCDFRCRWCDSLYAVTPEVVHEHAERLTVDEIAARLRALNPHTPWVTLSGGNPAIHDLAALVERLHAEGRKIAVETQGTVFREWLRACEVITVSPKPPSSGMMTNYIQLDRFAALPNANLKVVVFDEADYAYARDIHLRYPHVPFYLQVGNPVGEDDTATLLAKLDWLGSLALADPAMGGAIVLPQLHVLLYGNRRGV